MFEILTSDEMKKAEVAAINGGISGFQLMTNAARAVVNEITACIEKTPVLVLCGGGNNGGDGFLAASFLKDAGWTVRVACLVKKNMLKGDAALAAKEWDGPVESLNSNLPVHQTGLVIDAVFGTGFKGALDPEMAILFDKIRTRKIPVAAIDIPSGIDCTTGHAAPGTLDASLTVTFTRKKTAHILRDSKNRCGRIVVANIGIDDKTVADAGAAVFENHPALWLPSFPLPAAETHKYNRGHLVVYGGDARTGAACLAAAAGQRAGAGAVTIAAPKSAHPVYAGYRASIMTDIVDTADDFRSVLRDERKTAVVIGPGGGIDDRLRDSVFAALSFNKSIVLDGDVFSVFAHDAKNLFEKLNGKCVLTPHDGEFIRLFGDVKGDKITKARHAARLSKAIVLLKGADTVIAAPDGTVIVHHKSPATLATAGSGDVLAGLIGGLAAQGMPVFMAAGAAVWLHAEAARNHGLGLVAEDIIFNISQCLNKLFGIFPDNLLKF